MTHGFEYDLRRKCRCGLPGGWRSGFLAPYDRMCGSCAAKKYKKDHPEIYEAMLKKERDKNTGKKGKRDCICIVCGEMFLSNTSTQICCGVKCAKTRAKQLKKERLKSNDK